MLGLRTLGTSVLPATSCRRSRQAGLPRTQLHNQVPWSVGICLVRFAGYGHWNLQSTHASAGDAAAASTSGSPAPSAIVDSAADGFWTPEFIRERVRQQEAEDEELMSEELIQPFRDDPEGLYDYVDEAYQEAQQLELGGQELDGQELGEDYPLPGYPAAAAGDIIGMGSWRLKGLVDPVVEFMVSRIEGCWREILNEDLCLYPRDKWKSLGWDLVDSEDPKRELDGFSYGDIPDPEKGADGYPRLQIENRIYCSKVFRKCHIEIAIRQDGMQVLHVVVYPRYSYDEPIFGLDLVIVNGRVTLAVVDCCPVRHGLKLPAHYMETMALLQRTFLEGQDPSARRIPDWGAAIFSPLALCITPATPEELAAFTKYAVALHRAYLTMSLNVVPVVEGPGNRRAAAKLQEIKDGQKRFCDHQLANKKTRRVLEAAFGQEWTDEYMSKVMFDFDPSYEPPYFEESQDPLHELIDETFALNDMELYNQGLEVAAEARRATQTLGPAVSGQQVSQEKLNLAMQFLLESDPTFRAAVETLTGGKEAQSNKLMTEELLSLLSASEVPAGQKKKA